MIYIIASFLSSIITQLIVGPMSRLQRIWQTSQATEQAKQLEGLFANCYEHPRTRAGAEHTKRVIFDEEKKENDIDFQSRLNSH